jgi:hypothetical protein
LAKLAPKRAHEASDLGQSGAQVLALGAQRRDDGGGRGASGPLELVPGVLEGAELPDGVVEIVVSDAQPAHCTLDIQGGRISVVEPGSAVPWTSISGSESAWTLALGLGGDVSQLRHTGEPLLAERVIAALGRRADRRLLSS